MGRKRSRRSAETQGSATSAALPGNAVAQKWRNAWPAVVVAVLALLVFAPSFEADFLAFDDPEYITGNAEVQQGLNGQTFVWAFTTTRFANWLPITWLSHLLDVSLYGLNPAGHHATSVLLHAINSAMVYLLLRRFAPGQFWSCLFAATVFAIHPCRVESVTWLAERKDVLCATFFLATLGAYLWHARRPSIGRLAVVSALYGLGLMAKTMIVTLPALVVLLDLWPLRRVRGWSSEAVDPQAGMKRTPGLYPQQSVWRLAIEKVPLVVLAAIACWWTIRLQDAGATTELNSELTLSNRLTNAAVSVSRYFGHLLVPIDLLPFYPHPITWPTAVAVAAIAVLVLTTAAAVWFGRRSPAVLLGWAWFLLMLLPVCGIVQAGHQALADRYTYLPGIGLLIAAIAVSAGIESKLRGHSVALRGLQLVAWMWLTVLPVLTIVLQGHWKTDHGLFLYTLTKQEANWLAHNHVGKWYFDQAAYDDSMRHHRRALELKPADGRSRALLSLALLRTRQFEAAEAELRTLIQQSPREPAMRVGLATALLMQRRPADASAELAQAHQINPDDVEVLSMWATSLLSEGKAGEAAGKAELALRLAPGHPDALATLQEARKRADVATRPSP
jgi:Flp pilus assembly protein TadD